MGGEHRLQPGDGVTLTAALLLATTLARNPVLVAAIQVVNNHAVTEARTVSRWE